MLIIGTVVSCRNKECRYNDYGRCKKHGITINDDGVCMASTTYTGIYPNDKLALWEYIKGHEDGTALCSRCRMWCGTYDHDNYDRYCSNCGARMIGIRGM